MRKSNILWGLLFIVIGVLIILDVFNVVNIKFFFKGWWTLFIIIPSFIDLFDRGFKMSNVLLLLLGIVLLLIAQDIIDYNLVKQLVLPVILILIGIKIIYKTLFDNKIKDEMKNATYNDIEVFTSFGSKEYNYNGQKFNGCNVDTVFGSAIINLYGVKLNEDVIIKSSTIFGKTVVLVPDGINVKVTSTSLFGGVTDNRKNKRLDGKFTVYIDAKNLFGGLEIDE